MKHLGYTIQVYRMLIVRKSEKLVQLAHESNDIEEFNKLFDEIQQLKAKTDSLEREYHEQYRKFA